jgi:hypothetical protein
VRFRLTSPTLAWNPDNDWSYQDIKNKDNLVKSGKIPIYDNGKLIYGTEPGK